MSSRNRLGNERRGHGGQSGCNANNYSSSGKRGPSDDWEENTRSKRSSGDRRWREDIKKQRKDTGNTSNSAYHLEGNNHNMHATFPSAAPTNGTGSSSCGNIVHEKFRSRQRQNQSQNQSQNQINSEGQAYSEISAQNHPHNHDQKSSNMPGCDRNQDDEESHRTLSDQKRDRGSSTRRDESLGDFDSMDRHKREYNLPRARKPRNRGGEKEKEKDDKYDISVPSEPLKTLRIPRPVFDDHIYLKAYTTASTTVTGRGDMRYKFDWDQPPVVPHVSQ